MWPATYKVTTVLFSSEIPPAAKLLKNCRNSEMDILSYTLPKIICNQVKQNFTYVLV